MEYLLVKGGIIENIIVLDSPQDWTPPTGYDLVKSPGVACIGWVWDGVSASDPNPPQEDEGAP